MYQNSPVAWGGEGVVLFLSWNRNMKIMLQLMTVAIASVINTEL
jgi:hypothetical protein